MNRQQRRCKHPERMQKLVSTNKITGTEMWTCGECYLMYPKGGVVERVKKIIEDGNAKDVS